MRAGPLTSVWQCWTRALHSCGKKSIYSAAMHSRTQGINCQPALIPGLSSCTSVSQSFKWRACWHSSCGTKSARFSSMQPRGSLRGISRGPADFGQLSCRNLQTAVLPRHGLASHRAFAAIATRIGQLSPLHLMPTQNAWQQFDGLQPSRAFATGALKHGVTSTSQDTT